MGASYQAWRGSTVTSVLGGEVEAAEAQADRQPGLQNEFKANLEYWEMYTLIPFLLLKKGTNKIADWVQVLLVKPDDLSSILGTRRVKRKNQHPQTVL